MNTPDLLFLDHVEINGEPVAWIDAKHFYGADVNFKERKSLDRLVVMSIHGAKEHWCLGMVLWKCPHSRYCLLDCGPLDLEPLNQSTEE